MTHVELKSSLKEQRPSSDSMGYPLACRFLRNFHTFLIMLLVSSNILQDGLRNVNSTRMGIPTELFNFTYTRDMRLGLC